MGPNLDSWDTDLSNLSPLIWILHSTEHSSYILLVKIFWGNTNVGCYPRSFKQMWFNLVASWEADFLQKPRKSHTNPKVPPKRIDTVTQGRAQFGKVKVFGQGNYGAVRLHCKFHHPVSAQISSTMVLLSFYVFTRRLVRQLWWRKFPFMSNLNTQDEWGFFPLWPGI